jgi:hypothetical protein
VAHSSTGSDIHHLTLRNCESYGHAKHGFYIASLDGTEGPHDVLLEDCIAHDNGTTAYTDHGFYVAFGVTLDRCIAYNNISAGIKLNSNTAAGSPYAPIVKNCKSYNNDEDGLYIGHYNCLIYNNLLYGNKAQNIKFDSEGDDNELYFNTLVNSTHAGNEAIDVAVTNETGNIFKNNIFIQDSAVVNNSVWYILGSVSGYLADNTLDYNVYYISGAGSSDTVLQSSVDGTQTFAQLQSAGGETNGSILTSLPEFLARYTDFHVIEGGNLDIAGVAITGITLDFDDVSRGSPPNVGAYEPTRIGDAQSAYLEGESAAAPISDSQSAFLKGKSSDTDNQPAFLRGSTNTLDNQGAYTRGATSLATSTTAFVRGSIDALDNVSAYLVGVGIANDSIPTFIDVTGQALVPDGDVVDGNWVNESSETNLYPSLADDNDSTYVWIDGGVQNDTFTVQLSNPDGVPASGPHYLMWKIYNKGGSGSISLKIELWNGGTLIKSDTQTVPAGATEYIIKLDQADVDKISDYTNLTVKVIIEGVA